MTDTYAYLIHEPDWESDDYLEGGGVPGGAPETNFPAHQAFQDAVERLGARIVGGSALQNARHGGRVTPGAGDRVEADAVYSDGPYPDTTEVVSGFYLVETDDEALARRIAALVPTGGHVEWRKVFPTS
ncbi:YciI family protein [Agromyces italicus]|uniref:YciI family protein n=1 Tax=Agromyces italicus TaxID=279572 RepID=UPI0003B4B2AC|nr:YciI family protein [Agromyces italicus]